MTSAIATTVDAAAGIVRVNFITTPSFEDWSRAMEAAFAHPDYRAGFGFLVDRRAVPPAETAMVRQMIDFIDGHRAECAGSRWAFLVATRADYGMVRMTQFLAEDHPTELNLFDDPERALAWLMEDRARETG